MFFAAGAPTPLYGVYQAQLRFSATTLTAILAIYALVLLLTLLVFGSVSDYLGHCSCSLHLPRLRSPVAAADQPVADRAESVDRAGDPPEGLTSPDLLCRLLPDVPPCPGRGEGVPGQDQHHDPAGLAFHG